MARQGRPSIAAPSHISGALLQQRCAPAPSLHALPDGLLQSQILFYAWAAPWTLRPPLNHPTFILLTPELDAGWQPGPLRRCSSGKARSSSSRATPPRCARMRSTALPNFFCCCTSSRLAPAILSPPSALSDPVSGALFDGSLLSCVLSACSLLLGLVAHDTLDPPGGSRRRGGMRSGLPSRARSVTSLSRPSSPRVAERA